MKLRKKWRTICIQIISLLLVANPVLYLYHQNEHVVSMTARSKNGTAVSMMLVEQEAGSLPVVVESQTSVDALLNLSHRAKDDASSAATVMKEEARHGPKASPFLEAQQKQGEDVQHEEKESNHLKHRFETLPQWMQEYFQWHYETRQRIMTNQTLQQQWKRRIQRQRNQQSKSDKSDDDFPTLFILQCLESNQKCGGTADRLKPIPLLLLAAATKCRPRKCLFFIRWTRPFALQEFLVPPPTTTTSYYALDWRVPEWMEKEFSASAAATPQPLQGSDDYPGLRRVHIPNVQQVLPRTLSATGGKKTDIITTLIQWHDGGQLIYDAQPENQVTTISSNGTTTSQQQQQQQGNVDVSHSEFRRIYHVLFRLLFVPVPPMERRLQDVMQEKGLIPGHYVVAQYRAFYRERQAPPTVEMQQSTGINAVNCASKLRVVVTPTDTAGTLNDTMTTTNTTRTTSKSLSSLGPVYFASDSKHAVQAVREYALREHHPIVTLDDNVQLLHLDRDGEDDYYQSNNKTDLSIIERQEQRTPKDYYPVFMDLFLMGGGRCISYGDGGFARFGLMLSYNYTCESRHWWKRKIIPCPSWTGVD